MEKAPCTNVSDRVCVCRPGMRCESESPNACSLCVPLTTSEPGFGVRTAGRREGWILVKGSNSSKDVLRGDLEAIQSSPHSQQAAGGLALAKSRPVSTRSGAFSGLALLR